MSDPRNPATAAPAPADPARDRTGTAVPERIAELLAVVAILTEYGRYLLNLLERPGLWRGFATVAQCFGTGSVAAIVPYVQRGIMRAVALERALLARARRGRDLQPLAPRVRAKRKPLAAATPHSDVTTALPPELAAALPPEAAAALARIAALASHPMQPQAHRRRNEQLTCDTIPSMAELEAEACRRPVGRSITAICQDLGVAFRLCERLFGIRLFDAIRQYGGSLGAIMQETRRREKRFEQDLWRHPGLELPEQTEPAIRRALGFCLGEPMADPFHAVAVAGIAVAAAATGPP